MKRLPIAIALAAACWAWTAPVATGQGATFEPEMFGGLEATERIARVVIDPRDSDTVFACATGHLFDDLKIEISDASGKLLTTINGGRRKGINRVEWPMRSEPPRFAPGSGIIPNLYALMGPRVLEGTYKVKLITGKDAYTTEIRLVPDPRSKATAEDRRAQREGIDRLFGLVERSTDLILGITSLRDEATERAARLPAADSLRKRAETFAAAMEKQRTALVATSKGEGISGDERLREELGTLYGNVNGFDGRPTKSQVDRMGVLAMELDAAVAAFNAATTKELAVLNQELTTKKIDQIAVPAK